MKNIFTVLAIALLTLTLFQCKKENDSPSSHQPVVNHVFGFYNTRYFNLVHMYEKTYNMLTVMPINPSGSMMTLNFIMSMPPDSGGVVGWLQLPSDGYYTLKVIATDGSYVKWDNHYMVRDGKTDITIMLYPDCLNYGPTKPFMSFASETKGPARSQRNTGHHIKDGSSWCDANP